jgi:hypothetical protein
MVTPSSFISATSVAGSPIFGPGNTSLVPTIGAVYGKPQAFAWNIGTTASTTSLLESPVASTVQPANECSTVERCV